MGLLSFFKKTANNRHIIDDSGRENSLKTRRLNAEIKQLKQEAELETLKSKIELEKEKSEFEKEKQKLDLEIKRIELEAKRSEYDDEEEESTPENNSVDTLLLQGLMKGFLNPQSPHPQNEVIPPNQLSSKPEKVEPTDEEIKSLIDSQIPKKYIKKIKTYPDIFLLSQCRIMYPAFSDKSILRAIEILKTEY